MTVGGDDDDRVEALVAAFRQVDEDMRGLPIHNPALAVEAVGFQPFGQNDGDLVGVLVTPWFISLVLLPADRAGIPGPDDADAGRRTVFSFPSGDYAFLPGEAGDGLRYWSCHLFSPVTQFGDQQMAQEAATGALEALLAPTAGDDDTALEEAKAEPEKRSRRSLFGGRTGHDPDRDQ